MHLTTLFTLALAAAPWPGQAAPAVEPSASHPLADALGRSTGVASPAGGVLADERFAPWLGCWELDDERLSDGLGVARLCVVRGDERSVRLLTVVGSRVANQEAVIADGVAHPISDTDCFGTELAEWATHIPGFFRTVDVTCGDGQPRKVNSIAFLVRGPAWVDVQAVRTEEKIDLRVRRYRRAADQSLPEDLAEALPSAPVESAAAADQAVRDWTIDSVVEASRKLPTEAVQAAITELDRGFDLRAKQLATLADAGIGEPVINLMLALTYPERFVVKRMASGGGWSAPSDFGLWMSVCDSFDLVIASPCMMSMYYSDFYWSDYGPFGYYGRYYGDYNEIYGPGYDGGWVVVPGPPPPEPRHGRVVNGMGYTQVTARGSEPVHGTASFGGDGGGGATSSPAGVSSQGYSSGSSSNAGGGERTAQPRPPQ